QDLLRQLLPEKRAHGDAREVIAHGVPYALRLADMGHHVEGAGALARPDMAEALSREIGQDAAQDPLQLAGDLIRALEPAPRGPAEEDARGVGRRAEEIDIDIGIDHGPALRDDLGE